MLVKNLRYILLLFPVFTLFGFHCNKEQHREVFTGKVALKGICGNTVIQIVEGDTSSLPAGSYTARWTDPTTGISYENVFTIGNICQIDGDLNEGDQFIFTPHDHPNNSCITCLAWSPAPESRLAIKILR